MRERHFDEDQYLEEVYPDEISKDEIEELLKAAEERKAVLDKRLSYYFGSNWRAPEPVKIMRELDEVEAEIRDYKIELERFEEV